jgi:predicted Zn-ribbon and HTH transcriptional regulator
MSRNMQTRFSLDPLLVKAIDRVLKREEYRQTFVTQAVITALYRRGQYVLLPANAVCVVCGRSFDKIRANRMFCSAACRVKRSRDRKALAA